MKRVATAQVNCLIKKGRCTIAFDNLYLIPTAEVPVTNIFRDVILDAEGFSDKIYCIPAFASVEKQVAMAKT